MLNTIQELINYYSQKFHLSILFATQEWQISNWQGEGILIGMPPDGGETSKFGTLEVAYNPSFGQSLEGKKIRSRRKPVAKVGKQFLILQFYPKNKTSEKLVMSLIDKSVPKMARFIRQSQLKTFLENMQSVSESIQGDKERAIQSNEWEIDRLSQEIHDLSRKIEADRLILKFFQMSQDKLKQKAIRMYIDLNKLVPGIYTSFKIEESRIIGTTQSISIWFEDYEYRFEPYTVEVNIQNGKISITGSANEVNDYIHPHISDSSICWGNIGPTVNKLQGQLELHGLFSLVHQFLSTYNADDPFQRIEHWNPNWIDEDENEDEPYCSWCDSYSHEIDDCELCWWCNTCHETVDHEEDQCPRKEAEVEAA